MDEAVRDVFGTMCSALTKEAERVRGFPSAAPLHLLAGLRGLAARSEAHLAHVLAHELSLAGYTTLVDEPYPIQHQKGKVRRFDLRIVIESAPDPLFARFLTVELKRYLLLDHAMGGLLWDIKKLKEILANDYGILNVPLGFLMVGFSHKERDEWIRRRLSSFVGRAELGDWVHLEKDFRIAPKEEPMNICLVDFWFFSGEIRRAKDPMT